ncbi:hypothetical protein OK016_26540 [Vibrio chagasii]|nr:hypothetical protein [Vibrio chagasii]
MKEMLVTFKSMTSRLTSWPGGGVDFMRVWAPDAYNIPWNEIIGSALKCNYSYNDDNRPLPKIRPF